MEYAPSAQTSPLIYNLFPRLAGPLARWPEHFERAASLGFDWVYLNPVFYPGFSGSLYAVKDFSRLDPVVAPEGAGLETLAGVLDRATSLGLRPMVDLVINHTAKDSPLVESHPGWYKRDGKGRVQSPFAIDPADARRKTVWGDLAELDFEETDDPDGLLGFVLSVAESCLDAGFEGFRCDAAYKVPAPVWIELTRAVKARCPDAIFVAETLGCRPAEMMALEAVGFDFVMNSSKYWAFDAPWCLEQHEEWQSVAPSVSFPESHDTPRLAAETGGLRQVQEQRLAFAAFFSAGLLVPVGYELGFRRRLDVVKTRAEDWEEPLFDLCDFVRAALFIKRSSRVLSREGHLEALTPLDRPTLALEKVEGEERALILVNKDWRAEQELDPRPLLEGWDSPSPRLYRPSMAGSDPAPLPEAALRLGPAEVAVVLD